MNDIYLQVQNIKKKEQELLINRIKNFNKKLDCQYECYEFIHPYPIIAGYLNNFPSQIEVTKLIVRDNKLYIIILDQGDLKEIEPDDVFAGQLDFLIDYLPNENMRF